MSKKLSLFLILISVGLLTALAAGPVFGAGGPPDDKKLKDWHARSLGLFEMEGVFWTDADEQRRIIVVGVRNDGMGESVKRRAEKLGIDPASVETVVAEPIHQLTGHDLRSPFRTIQGGTQIQFVSGAFLYSCTLGFNAVRGGVEGFVTNSHCTDKQGGVENTKHYQSAYSGDFVSTETADPEYLKSTCPRNVRGKVCRYSDSSFSALTDPADGALGAIARPDGVNNGSLDIDTQNPSFTITGEASGNATVGDEINKVGRTTGWSQGIVTNTCVHTGVQGSKIVQLCQDFVSAGVGGGDSGSPVFMINQDGTVTLYGILWGGSGSSMFVYSPMANIQMNTTELGALTTYGTPPVDNTAPLISNVAATGVTAASATISWDTDEASDSGVEYGETASYGSAASAASMVTSHSINLTGLAAETTYHYEATSEDGSSNSASSGAFTFTTAAEDTTPPVISNVTASNITATTADVTWTTDEVADSTVDYGLDTTYVSAASDANMVTSHTITLTGLSAETTYHYEATSEDGSANSASSGDFTFTTVAVGSDVMYVSAIDMVHKTRGKGELNTTITILQDGGAPMSGATVDATLSRPDGKGGTVTWNWSVNTNSEGKVLLKLKFPLPGATYTMCVNNVTHSHTYDSAQNVETCDFKTT